MTESIRNAKNKDLAGSLAAIQRAAESARELAVRTNTAIIVCRDGKIDGKDATAGMQLMLDYYRAWN
jgi:hypothetical protein